MITAARPRQNRFDLSDQFHFDWSFPHSHPLLYVEEVADLMDCSTDQVIELADGGRFLSFAINHDPQPERERLRIVRATVNTDLIRIVLEDWLKTVATVDQWLFPHSRQVVTPREAAIALRCNATHVRALYDAGRIRAVNISNGRMLERDHLRIERASVAEFVRCRIRAKNGISAAGNERAEVRP